MRDRRWFNGGEELGVAERLSVGVALRLSRYLQVLTQAEKIGKQRISSQELSAYTNINATQLRRDLSGFGKFGKRGVGYSVDHLQSVIGELLLSQREHKIALVGAGRLGQAIANSPIFSGQTIRIAAIFDSNPDKIGRRLGDLTVSDCSQLRALVRRDRIVIGVLAVPAASAQQAASDLVAAGVKIIFNYSEALLDLPPQVHVLTSNPAAQLIATLHRLD
jgi:redox-sensing transcriptional repressor